MLDKLINETKNAIVAAVKGTDDTLSALRTAVENQVTGALKDVGAVAVSTVEGALKAAGTVGVSTTEMVRASVTGALKAADSAGSEAGSAVRRALLSASSLPKDVVEAAIRGSSKRK